MKTMYKYFYITILAVLPILVKGQCFNGDVENNSFANWTAWSSTGRSNINGNINWNLMAQGVVNGKHTIMNTGLDPLLNGVGVPLQMVFEGNHSIRLSNGNQPNPELSPQIIAYTFQVTDPTFSFRYAAVMEYPAPNNAPHGELDLPFFSYRISTGGAALTKATKFNTIKTGVIRGNVDSPYVNSVNIPGQGGKYLYTGWKLECIDLSQYIGKTVTIYFTAAPCALIGHFSYAYIDALCKTPDDAVPNFTFPSYVCVDDELWVDGSASQNVNSHYWKIEQLSSNNITSVIPNTACQVNFDNQHPGYIGNLLKGTKMKMCSFPPGYYKLTLGVKNCSGGWTEKSVVIELRNPQINVNEYIYKCCDDQTPPFIATVDIANTVSGGSFAWCDAIGNPLGSGQISVEEVSGQIVIKSVFFAPSALNGKYKVTYTDPNGCKSEKWVYVINRQDFSVFINTDYCPLWCSGSTVSTLDAISIANNTDYCGETDDIDLRRLTHDASNNTYVWSTGETTRIINKHSGVDNYSVTVSNGCFSHTATIDLSILKPLTGKVEESSTATPGKIKIPQSMYLSGGNTFTIYQWGLVQYQTPAYNSTKYKLSIYNRWGQRVYLQSRDAVCENLFWNGEMSWDGKFHNKIVDLGYYHYKLELQNCDHNNDNGNANNFKGQFVIY